MMSVEKFAFEDDLKSAKTEGKGKAKAAETDAEDSADDGSDED